MSRVARTWQAALAALGVVLFAVGLGTVATTTAAWTDPAVVTLQASTGQWAPAPSAGPVTAGDNTEISELVWELHKNPAQACFTFTVTTTSREIAVPWSIMLDLRAAPFNGVSGGWSGGDLGQLVLDSSVAGRLRISGSTSGAPNLKHGQTFTFRLCNWALPEPSIDPNAYKITTVPGTWTTDTACTVVTVSGTGTSPFYFAWEYDLDLSAAKALTGGSRVSWSNYEAEHLVQGALLHTYSRAQGNLKGTETLTDTVCVHKN